MTLPRRAAAEALGTGLLLAMVVGSASMADRLAGGNAALALLANSIASGLGLLALILTFGAISGAHFNPALSLSEAWQGRMDWRETPPYVAAQVLGAFAGVAAAHTMFGEPAFSAAAQARTGAAQWWSEFIATFGLIAVISGCTRSRPAITPFAVAAYIVSAYWFTASSSFANPALTLARAATSTVAGIRFEDVSGYVAAQLLGMMAATVTMNWLHSPAGAPAFKPVPPP
ncbi:aquaporin family protein [Pseudoduganella eburnea]|uniref:Aquaporin family protein n=1 Tax=Massilia eburnea TaxID=1776165 RepID=A0A6L6QKT8_9BURK|nr:MIP/aquaporin family protein [Massilia eburnea]MTW12740.1 aquaporin family protein [Massilia eburnea]